MSETRDQSTLRVAYVKRREFPWEVRLPNSRCMAFETKRSAERFIREEYPKELARAKGAS